MTVQDPPGSAGPVRSPHAARAGWLSALLALCLGAFAYRALWSWDPATHDLPPLEGWIFLASEHPPQAVFALALVLVVVRRRALAASLAGIRAPGLGAAGVALGLALLAGGRAHASPALQLVSFVALGLGGACLVGGRALARELAFPLGLLLLALPFPDTLYLPLVSMLEQATTAYAAALLGWLGVPALREGETLTLANDVFMIIETCSGAGSIAILLLLAAFWAGLTRASGMHTLVLLGIAPGLAFVLNGLRVLTLILTPGSEGARLHVLQGLILFQGGVLGLWLADRLVGRLLPARAPAAPVPGPLGAPPPAWGRATLCGGLAALVSVAWPLPSPTPTRPPWSMALPEAISDAPATQTPVDGRFLGSLQFGWMQHVRYGDAERGVDVFVGSEDPRNPHAGVVSPKNRVPGRGYDVLSVEAGALGPPSAFGEEVIAVHGGRQVLSWVLYEGVAGRWAEAVAGTLGLGPDALGNTPRGRVLRLSTPVANFPGGASDGRSRLETALTVFQPDFAEP